MANPNGYPKTLIPYPKISWKTGGKADGGSKVIRVPAHLAASVIEYAHRLDLEAAESTVNFVTQEGEIAIQATESDGTDEDEWIEEVLGFKMNEDGTIPEEVQEEIERFKNGEPQETQQELELTKEEFTDIHEKVKRGGYEADEDRDRAYNPKKWAERQTFWDVNNYVQRLIGEEFKSYRYNEDGLKLTIIDWPARNEKIKRLKESPEIKDWELERFSINLEKGDYVWRLAAPEQDELVPNYYKMQISPEKFDRIATHLINYKKGEQVSIDECCKSWAIEETLIRAKEIVELEGDEHEIQRVSELQYEVSKGDLIFIDAAETLVTGRTGDADFSDLTSWAGKTAHDYYMDALVASSELTRVTDNIEKHERNINRLQKHHDRKIVQAIRPHELLTPRIIATHGPNYGSAGWVMEQQLCGSNWNKAEYVNHVASEAYSGDRDAADELAVLRARGWDIPQPTKKQRKVAKSQGKLAEMKGKR